MDGRSPDLSDLAGELDRLLRAGQAPIIAQRLRASFLGEVRRQDGQIWVAYGFRVALDLAEAIVADPPRNVSPEILAEFDDSLTWCRDQDVPPVQGAFRWSAAAAAALVVLSASRQELTAILAGEGRGGLQGADSAAESSAPEASVNIPVVVRLERADPRFPLFAGLPPMGQIVRLTVRAHVRILGRTGPHLSIDKDRDKATRAAFQVALPVLRALRAPGAPPLRRCGFDVLWDVADGHLSGESATLGFLLAAAAAWSKLSPAPVARIPSPELAVSGSVREDEVGSVDGIPEKVRACFHGPTQILHVPESNRTVALETLRDLENRHPARQLLIRGVNRVDDAWRDPGALLSLHRPVRSLARIGFQRLLGSRLALGLVIGAFLIAAGSWWASELYLSQQAPARAEPVGNSLLVWNRHNRKIWQHQFECPPWAPINLRMLGEAIVLPDMDGDGVQEVAALHGSTQSRNDSLSAFSPRGRRLWTAVARGVGPAAAREGEDLSWKGIFVVPSARGRGSDLLVMRKSTMGSLTVLDLLRGTDGVGLGRLRNQGHLEGIYVMETEGSGTRVCLAFGFDNESGGGLLARIDLAEMARGAGVGPDSLPPRMTDPASLKAGVLWAIRFAKDTFAYSSCATVENVDISRPDYLDVGILSGLAGHEVVYTLFVGGPGGPVLQAVRFTDSYKDGLRFLRGVAALDSLPAEQLRLAGKVEELTPSGWEPLASRTGGISEALREGR